MPNQLRLHGHPISSNTRRCMLVLEHLGLAYELVPVNLADPAARAGLRPMNPNAKIPVLEHGDFVLWESHAIMQYVSELAPGQLLYPYAPRDRADVNRWLFWHNAHLAPPLGTLGFERRWKALIGRGAGDPAVIAAAEQVIAQQLALVEEHLTTRAYLAGSALSLADLSLAATLANAPIYGTDLSPYPHVRTHLARIASLPAWAATAPAPMPPMSPTPAAKPQGDRAVVS